MCFTIIDFRPHIAGNDHPRTYCMLCLLFSVRYSSRSFLNVVSFWSARAKASSRILVPVPDHIYFVDKGHRWQCAGKQLALMIKCYNISHVILRTTREDTPDFELLTNLSRSNNSILLLKSSPKYFNRILLFLVHETADSTSAFSFKACWCQDKLFLRIYISWCTLIPRHRRR